MTSEEEWWIGDYAEEIHDYLRLKERKRLLFRGQSPQLHMRKKMINWMDDVCQKMKFCKTVQHLAVYLLDIFMDNHTIHCDHLHMVIIGCLTVAVKLEENDNLIPKNSDLNVLVGKRYKLIEFVQMEMSVLNFFKWDVLFPTAAHFAEYYTLYAVQPSDKHENRPMENYDFVKMYVQKYIDYFLEVTILEPGFINLAPSMVAAACIASTRTCLTLSPPWPLLLQKITSYNYTQLKPCVELMLRALEVDMLMIKNQTDRKSPDSSHCSKTNSSSLPVSPDCMVTS